MKNGSGTEIIEENNFYPFGLKHEGYNAQIGNPAYNYQYNGKELQKETGWSDYGARMYMADIGRWGVIDPLAEQYRRLTPYNYVANNPISFIDPDGRKMMAPKGNQDSQPPAMTLGGMMEFYANGGRGSTADVLKFLGQEDMLGSFYNLAMFGVTGGGNAEGMSFSDPSMIALIQQGVSQPGFINGLFSLADQLEKAGFKDPAHTKAKFDDWGEIIKIDAIQELISKLYKVGGYKAGDRGLKAIETKSSFFHGKSNGFDILIQSPKTNVLEYAFTIGHEIDHSITFYFRNLFFETLHTNVNNTTARGAFEYFNEYISYSWEAKLGNSNIGDPETYTYSKHGASNIPSLFRRAPAEIEKFKSNQNIIMRAYWTWFNNIK